MVLEDDSLGELAGLVARHLKEAGLICIAALENPAAGPDDWVLEAEGASSGELVKRLLSLAHREGGPESMDFDI